MNHTVEKNQEIMITIKSIGINGEGIGFYKRQAVFVEGAIPPEEAVVTVKSLHKGYAVGELIRIKKKSFHRTRAFCKHFGVCGGCQLQHVEYEEQLRLKEDLLKQSFSRFTKDDDTNIRFLSHTPLSKPSHYLQTAQMFVHDDQEMVTALRHKDGKSLIDVMYCPIQHKNINTVNQRVIELCDQHGVKAFEPKTMHGLVRHIITRRSTATQEIQVTIVVTIYNHVLKKLAQDIIDIPNVSSVAISKNHDLTNRELFGETYEILAGNTHITESMGSLKHQLTPKTPYPNNPEETEKMLNYIQTLFEEKQLVSMIDVYTQNGITAMYLSDYFKEITGLEARADVIHAARENSKNNRVNNIQFIQGNPYKTLKDLLSQGKHYDVGILETPRSGLPHQMKALLKQHRIKHLVYVSSNPSTLAKDASHLMEQYHLKSVMPFDLAPQTNQLHSVAYFTLKKGV